MFIKQSPAFQFLNKCNSGVEEANSKHFRSIRKDVKARIENKNSYCNSILNRVLCCNWGINSSILQQKATIHCQFTGLVYNGPLAFWCLCLVGLLELADLVLLGVFYFLFIFLLHLLLCIGCCQLLFFCVALVAAGLCKDCKVFAGSFILGFCLLSCICWFVSLIIFLFIKKKEKKKHFQVS